MIDRRRRRQTAAAGAVRLWHVPTGRALFTLSIHPSLLIWVEFASSRKLLVGAPPKPGASVGVFVFDAQSHPR